MNQSQYTTKRSYHPLVMVLFFSGALDSQRLKQIPSSTIQYWNSIKHENLYGYDWISDRFENFQYLETTQREAIIRKSINICSRIVHSFTNIFAETKSYKRILRDNADKIIGTIDRISSEIKLKTACKIFDITTNKYYRWKNKLNCSASIVNLCYNIHPTQLTLKENIIIHDTVNAIENVNRRVATMYYSLMRSELIACCLSTFYKYASLNGRSKAKYSAVPKENKFRANKPFEYLHIDTTFVMTEFEGKQRVVFVKDNYSKTILHKAIVPAGDSIYIKEILEHTFEEHNLFQYSHKIRIISDGGSENKGEVSKWAGTFDDKNVTKIIAKDDNNFSNNMIESSFNFFKNEFMAGKIPKMKADLYLIIEAFVKYNNHEWFPIEFHGLKPMEVLQGEIPDKNRFKEQIAQAKQNRITENQSFDSQFCKTCT